MNDGLDEAAQTAAEHAAAAAAEPGRSAMARPSRPAALEPDVPDGRCANCEAELQGPVCHQCGQVDDEYHRPARNLVGEVLESLLALDGRVARTIPNLLGRPGRITRDYLKGRRARYMPPFRLYIVASLIFFLLIPGVDQLADGFTDGRSGALGLQQAGAAVDEQLDEAVAAGELTAEDAVQARETLERLGLSPRPGPQPEAPPGDDAAVSETESQSEPLSDAGSGRVDARAVVIGPGGDPDAVRRFFAPEDFGESPPRTVWPLPVRRYLGERFAEVREDPGGWVEAARAWVPRIMFAMVPVYGLLLSLIYAWRRRFYFYDHLVVSLHFHSALFLAMSAWILIGGAWAFLALMIYANVYLYRLHRVVYARGRLASALRTLTLDVLYAFVLTFGLIAVLLLGALAG